MMPKVSIAIPFYKGMKDADFFLERCLQSIREQSFQDYEIVVTKTGKAAKNTNNAIKKSTGELIKIMYMDDSFSHKNALKEIVEAFSGQWLITGSHNNVNPVYTGDIHLGNNKLGCPSALTIKNDKPLFFDENLHWLFDSEYYKRMYELYGEPIILNGNYVTVGVGEHQATNTLTNKEKEKEVMKMRKKYV